LVTNVLNTCSSPFQSHLRPSTSAFIAEPNIVNVIQKSFNLAVILTLKFGHGKTFFLTNIRERAIGKTEKKETIIIIIEFVKADPSLYFCF